MDSYHYWERELKRRDFTFGQFWENFTVEGLADSEVCVGDRYRIGGALFEVTQLRVTCYRVGIRMDEPRMAALLVSITARGSTFVCSKRARWEPATKSSRLPMDLNAWRERLTRTPD
jgi:MOSC domain-containing protein YiiM